MADQNLPPTKNNLRIVQDELAFATLGFNLLDQKRNILVMELMKLINQATSFENRTEQALRMAYQALQQTILESGRLHTLQLALSVNTENQIKIHSRKVMGVSLPVVETSFVSHEPYYSSLGVAYSMDQGIEAMQDALNLTGKLAEMKISIMRLASEVKKTIHRVNALEKISIPQAKQVITSIENRLEESERDMLVIMKNVKKFLETKEGGL